MAQINTRIVLRNDTKAAWEAVKDTATLMVGEMGVETDTGLFKIGCQKKNAEGAPMFETDGTTPVLCTWAELEYANDIPQNTVQVVDGTVEDLDDGVMVGDMAIVRAVINGNVKSHTAYVWNGEAWEAMDGNYNASNVYFKNDITLAGSYTAVGNVTKSSNAATGTLSAAGKSLDQVMQSIFTKELFPATGGSINKPTIEISGDSNKEGEVGSTYSLPAMTLTVKDIGAYTYGPATGIKFEAGKLTLAEGAVASATNKATNTSDLVANGTVTLTAAAKSNNTDKRYTDGTETFTFNASGSYTQGAAPKTNLGNLLDTDDSSAEAIAKWTYRIPAGTATASAVSRTRKGWRNFWYGFISTTDTTGATIYRVTDSTSGNYNKVTDGAKFLTAGGAAVTSQTLPTITAAAGDRMPVVLVPKGSKAVTSASMPSSLNAPVTFVKAENTIKIHGFNGYTEAEYDLWYYKADDMPVGADFSIVLG